MSETYPKSNIWPFVLSGMLLLVLVVRPPSELEPELRQLICKLQENWITSKNTLSTRPKIVGHQGWTPQPHPVPNQATPHAALAPAPTWNVAKVTLPATVLPSHDVSIDEPAHLERVGQRLAETRVAAYVWQPPKDWVAELIDPFAERLAVAVVSEPVAKLKSMGRQPRNQRPPLERAPTATTSPIPSPEIPSIVEPEVPETKDEKITHPSDTSPSNEEPRVVTSDQSISPTLTDDGPAPKSELEQLLDLGSELPRLEKWSRQLSDRIREFRQRPLVGDAHQRQAVELLSKLANYPVDVQHWSPFEQETYWRIRFATQRRADVWQTLLDVASRDKDLTANTWAQSKATARELMEWLASEPRSSAWSDHLGLEDLATAEQPHEAAEKVLLRLRSPQLTPQQDAFLRAREFRNLETKLRAAISQGVTAEYLATVLENYEDQADAESTNTLLASLQRFATGPHSDRYVPTIHAIDTHYRNANLRVSVSEDLINQFLPAMHQYAEQVNDTILGASVRGRNATWTNFSVQLIPDSKSIRIGLLAKGQVHSKTSSRKGPVTFYNRGNSQFAAGKQVVLTSDGVHLGQTETRASTGNRMIGMRTDWDDVPVVGWLVRTFALQQHDEQRPFLRAEVLRRVRQQTAAKFDVEVQRRMASAEQQVQTRLVQPLQNMKLDPRAMEMRSTADRAIIRARLAGPMQLGAHTPRPRALRNSKMSIQIHQTAANNFVGQVPMNGRRMTLEELASELSSRFGLEMDIAAERRSTTIEFAENDPLEFQFQDGKVVITLRFASLDNGQDQWKNFSVRGFYRPDIRRMEVELIRDGSIELITESLRLRDQIALRSIFTKVFDTNQRLELLQRAIQSQPKLRNLVVTQLTIRDGWISASIGEDTSTKIASEAASTSR